jgi:hypothetical protein
MSNRPAALRSLCAALTLLPGAAAAAPSFDWSAIALGTVAQAAPRKPGQGAWDAIGGYALSGTAQDTTDTGIRYGVTLRVGSGDYGASGDRPGHNRKITVNEMFLFFDTAWGRLRLGDEDGAADRAVDLLPILVGGQMAGDWTAAVRTPPPAGWQGRDSDDATKLVYQTPRLAGAQLGISFAPRRTSLVEEIRRDLNGQAERDFVELGGNYRGDAGPLSYELGVAWNHGRSNRPWIADTSDVTVAGLLLYGGFSVGVSWFDNGDSGRPVGTLQTGGATVQGTYENGPYGLTLFWHRSEVRQALTYHAYGIGTQWAAVADLLTVGLDLVRTRASRPAPLPREAGHVATLTARLTF